jgi:hypothetical protein
MFESWLPMDSENLTEGNCNARKADGESGRAGCHVPVDRRQRMGESVRGGIDWHGGTSFADT